MSELINDVPSEVSADDELKNDEPSEVSEPIEVSESSEISESSEQTNEEKKVLKIIEAHREKLDKMYDNLMEYPPYYPEESKLNYADIDNVLFKHNIDFKEDAFKIYQTFIEQKCNTTYDGYDIPVDKKDYEQTMAMHRNTQYSFLRLSVLYTILDSKLDTVTDTDVEKHNNTVEFAKQLKEEMAKLEVGLKGLEVLINTIEYKNAMDKSISKFANKLGLELETNTISV